MRRMRWRNSDLPYAYIWQCFLDAHVSHVVTLLIECPPNYHYPMIQGAVPLSRWKPATGIQLFFFYFGGMLESMCFSWAPFYTNICINHRPQSVAGPWPKTWAWRRTAPRRRARNPKALSPRRMDPRLRPREQRLPRQIERARVSLLRRTNPAGPQPLLQCRIPILSPPPLLPRRAGSFVGPEQQCAGSEGWWNDLQFRYSIIFYIYIISYHIIYSYHISKQVWSQTIPIIILIVTWSALGPPFADALCFWGSAMWRTTCILMSIKCWCGDCCEAVAYHRESKLRWNLDSFKGKTITASNAIHGWKKCLCWVFMGRGMKFVFVL